MASDGRSPDQLYACIMGGVAALVGVVTVLVCACVYVPALSGATSSAPFRYAAFGTFAVGIVCLLVNAFALHSRAFQKVTHALVVVAVTGLMVLAAHAVPNKTTVPIALALAAVAVGVAAPLGRYHKGDLRRWMLPCAIGLVVLIVAGALNSAVFGSSAIESVLAVAGIVLFTVLTAVDANAFVNSPDVCKFDCCEEGVLNLFLNFSNIVTDVMALSKD